MNAARRRSPVAVFGLVLFFAGLVVFVAALGAAHYTLDPELVRWASTAPAIKSGHRTALAAGLQEVEPGRFGSVFPFLVRVDTAIDAANDRLSDDGKIWDYDRGLYRYALAREASRGPLPRHTTAFSLGSIGLAALGALISFLPGLRGAGGIRNDGIWTKSVSSRGVVGIAAGTFLIGFYVLLYFFPEYIVNWIRLADPVSEALRGRPGDRWFFYGLLYTVAVFVMGVRMLIRYRHSRYHVVRTASVMFFQTGFAFLVPAVLAALNRPEYDFKNAWPLDYTFFYGWRLDGYTTGGAFGWFILFWGIGLAFVIVPLFAYLFGKRWYCSWVCGCGGLAETLGDPFRQLSDKSLRAWRIERWLVHGVLVFAVVMTGVVLANHVSDGAFFGNLTWRVQQWYGFAIGSIFAGVVGTGFYPLMGNRVWCRFGCPLAAILGIVQRFKSRFRITTNGGQCISCGNCSTYCEMGIDVRSYAQRGLNVVRASCVGCGVCAAVCPRGVLRLENGPDTDRFEQVDV